MWHFLYDSKNTAIFVKSVSQSICAFSSKLLISLLFALIFVFHWRLSSNILGIVMVILLRIIPLHWNLKKKKSLQFSEEVKSNFCLFLSTHQSLLWGSALCPHHMHCKAQANRAAIMEDVQPLWQKETLNVSVQKFKKHTSIHSLLTTAVHGLCLNSTKQERTTFSRAEETGEKVYEKMSNSAQQYRHNYSTRCGDWTVGKDPEAGKG